MAQDVPHLRTKPHPSCCLSRHRGHLCQMMEMVRAMVVVTISAPPAVTDLRTIYLRAAVFLCLVSFLSLSPGKIQFVCLGACRGSE